MSGSTTTTADRVGQAAEWLLWTQLTLSSPLHVFLPIRDMGVNGIVRIPGTDVATAIQVKSRHVLNDGKLHVLVRDSELCDPHVSIVAVVLDAVAPRLHDMAICVDVPTFCGLAFRRAAGHDSGWQASIPFPPGPDSRWHGYAVSLADLPGRLCPLLSSAEIPTAPLRQTGSDVGYRAEARLVAMFAEDPRLNAFRACPDLEIGRVLRASRGNRRHRRNPGEVHQR
ncbi:MAG: hypothetical protein ACR2GX_00150 [Candidatus Dormibacteria bacterium]